MARNAAHNELVRRALEELAILGYKAWKNETGVWFEENLNPNSDKKGRPHKYGKVGSGDITIILPRKCLDRFTGDMITIGQHVEAEAKTGKGRQNPNQKIHQECVVEPAAGAYILFRSVEDLICQLQAIK